MRSLSSFCKHTNDFKKWLVETLEFEITTNFSYYKTRQRIECNDGFSMSVQGGKYTYSTPREFGVEFTHMEIGYPSEREELILAYAESNDEPTDTVYPYVPVEVIIKVIKKHKGMMKNT